MNNPGYAGDSPAKRTARLEIYRVAARLWEESGRPGGHAIVLAGPEAKEIPFLRDYLKMDPAKTWFVDIDSTGLDLVRKEWPEANRFHGYLHQILPSIPTIGFMNLDFMGLFNRRVERTLRSARGKLLPNAIFSYTFYRCRETKVHHSLARIKDSAYEVLSKDQLKNLDTVRWVGTAVRLQDRLGVPNAKLVHLSSYRSTRSPMGVLVFHNR